MYLEIAFLNRSVLRSLTSHKYAKRIHGFTSVTNVEKLQRVSENLSAGLIAISQTSKNKPTRGSETVSGQENPVSSRKNLNALVYLSDSILSASITVQVYSAPRTKYRY